MRKFIIFSFSIAIMFSLVFQSCNPKEKSTEKSLSNIPFDSLQIAPFLKLHPELKKYKNSLYEIYRNYDNNYIWFDKKGIVEYGHSLYNKVIAIKDEGVSSSFTYQNEVDKIFIDDIKDGLKHVDAELLLTSLYLFYIDEVYKGIDHKTTTEIEWLLPRKKVNYTLLIDSIIPNRKLDDDSNQHLFMQYYLLRDALKRFRTIEQNGGWITIALAKNKKTFKPNDTSIVIKQIRDRLFVTGEIKQNNNSNIYDAELLAAVNLFQNNYGFNTDTKITAEHIEAMNIPVAERIKTIVVNMERCRWVSPDVFNANEFITVNIPAYQLNVFRNGKPMFQSAVVVGDSSTRTVIFAGKMSYLVFSPYWNLPKTILDNEVIPGIEKNKNYLKEHNMEWNNGKVRQLPGKDNSLGLVKFMFPNLNEIYFHDSPAKGLFNKEDRALSHGCVRVQKARELAITLLQDDKKWPVEKIDSAMNSNKEIICSLKTKIPVYIGYFTTWVDSQGQIRFYKDVYDRDDRLADLLFYKK